MERQKKPLLVRAERLNLTGWLKAFLSAPSGDPLPISGEVELGGFARVNLGGEEVRLKISERGDGVVVGERAWIAWIGESKKAA